MLEIIVYITTQQMTEPLKITNEPPHDKTNKMTERPAKTQINLGIRTVWSESSLALYG